MKNYKISCGLLEATITNAASKKIARRTFIQRFNITKNLFRYLKVQEL